MKFLSKEKILGKKFFYFLVLFFFQHGPSIAQSGDPVGVQSLDEETQELICIANTSSLEAQDICLEDKASIESVAVCSLYTSTYVAEALCLKNRALSSEDVLKCFIDTPELIEQICLVGSETSARIVSHFKATEGDSSEIVKEIENIKTEMENLLGEHKVRFNITEGRFDFHSN